MADVAKAEMAKPRAGMYKRMRKALTGKKEEEGASLVEYGLLVALIAVACWVTIQALGGSINTAFTQIKTAIDTAVGT